MSLNLAQMQPTRPGVQHSTLAVSRIPFIQTVDSPTLASVAAQHGFNRVGTDQYVHPADQSWLALNGGRIDRGVGNNLFYGVPQNAQAFPVAPAGSLSSVAAAQLPTTTSDEASLAAQLIRAGFTKIDPNIMYFSHPDQSWVAIVDRQTVVRGYGAQLVNPADGPQPAAPQNAPAPAAPQAPAAAPAFNADTVNTYQAVNPSFEDGFYACASLPFLQPGNVAADRATFTQLGFVEKATGYFEHPDGSWVSYTQNRIERGHAQSRFARVPVGPSRMQPQPPNMQYLGYAIANAKVAGLSAARIAAGDQALADGGFTAARPGFYKHSDGSFITAVGDKVYFGLGNQVLTAAPSIAAIPAVPVDINAIQTMASLWSMPSDPAGAKAFLLQNGYTEQRPGYFVQGYLWVAIENDQLYCGYSQQRYASVPTPSLLPSIQSSVAHQWMAIARTSQLTASDPQLVTQLGQLGFTQVSPSFYMHGDGSWIAVSNGQLVRGLQGNVFSDVPQPPAPGTFQQFTSVPPGTWHDWAHNHGFACARLPVWGNLTSAQCDMVLAHLGFVGDGSGTFHHPDGSVVVLNYYGQQYAASGYNPQHAATRFQAFDFGQFPYNRDDGRRSWQHMTNESVVWQQWVQNPSSVAPPWPKYGG